MVDCIIFLGNPDTKCIGQKCLEASPWTGIKCLALCLTVDLDELMWELRIYFCQVLKAKPEVLLL